MLCKLSYPGQPGGGKTGQQMTHYIIEDGLFAGAAADLLALGWSIQYLDRSGRFPAAPGPGPAPAPGKGGKVAPKGKAAPTRAKFVCPVNARPLHGASPG